MTLAVKVALIPNIMAVGDAHVFTGFLTPVLTQLFFPKPPTTLPTCFYRGERRKYTGKKVRLNRGSTSQPPGHESDTFTTEPPERSGSEEEVDILVVVEVATAKVVAVEVSFGSSGSRSSSSCNSSNNNK